MSSFNFVESKYLGTNCKIQISTYFQVFLCLESHRFVHPRAVHHRSDSGLERGMPFFCKMGEKCVLRQLWKNEDVHIDFLKTVLVWILHEVSILEFEDVALNDSTPVISPTNTAVNSSSSYLLSIPVPFSKANLSTSKSSSNLAS